MKPTIGRKVWYWGDGDPVHTRDLHQAFDAEIIFVEPDGDISIVYRDHYGSQYTLHQVALDCPTPGDRHGHFTKTSGGYCTWMPYQVQQSQPKGN